MMKSQSVKTESIKTESIKKYIGKNIYIMMFTALFVSLVFFNYAYKNDSNARFQSRLISLANTAAVSINAEQHNTLVSEKDENTAVYRQIKYSLQNIKKANPDVIYAYTLRKTKEKNAWEFVVDAEQEEPFHIGQAYDVAGQEAINKATLQPVADTELSSGRHGKFYSGFAPIKDEAGRTVGIVGVDISAKDLVEHQKNVSRYVNLGLVLFMIGLAVYSSRKINGRLEKSVQGLTQGIGTIVAGNYNHRIDLNSNDEFQQIGDAVNGFAEKMQESHQTVEVDLRSATEWKDKILKVYGDVISSMTKGRFNLVSEQDSVNVSREGLLYSEMTLVKPEDADKAGQIVEKLLVEKGFKQDLIKQYVVCVTEAAANVVKHVGQGDMQVRVLDNRLRVVVFDKGAGMDLELLPKILFQEDTDTATQDTGLAFIYKFADKVFLSTSEKGTLIAMDFEQK